jgi:TRAP-type C4-dicarboxylate transport system permease small subunit
MLRKAVDIYYRVLVGMMTGIFMALAIVVSYQVLSRYVDFVPRYLWTEEISRFCFIWVLLLGAAIAVRSGAHFTIDVLPQSLNPNLQRALEVLVLVLIGIIAVLMLFGGLRLVEIGMTRISSTSGIRLAWVFIAIPFSGFSMLVFTAERLLSVVRGEVVTQVSREDLEFEGD